MSMQTGYLMTKSPTKDTAAAAGVAAEAAPASATPADDAKPAAKKDPPPPATNNGDDEKKEEKNEEEEKPKAPKVKLVAAKTLLIRRALESPHTAGTPNDTPTLVPGALNSAAAAATHAPTAAAVAGGGSASLQMPLPNLPHTKEFPHQFDAFQQQQQQQFFAAQAYQRALAMEMHNKAMKAYEEEQKRKEAAAKAAANRKKRGRPKKTGAEKASPAKKVAATGADGEAVGAASGPALEWEGPPPEALDGGWPDGWVKRTYVRQGGTSAGTKDSYWFTPVENYKLRSITEVKAFLWALEKNGGDEKLARQASKRKPRKKAKVEPQPQSEQPASEFTAGNTTTVAAPVAAAAAPAPANTKVASPAASAALTPATKDATVVVQVGQKLPEEAPATAAKLGSNTCDV